MLPKTMQESHWILPNVPNNPNHSKARPGMSLSASCQPYLRCSSQAIAVCLRLPGAALCQRQPSLCPCHQRCLHRCRAQVNAQHTGGPRPARRGHEGMAGTLPSTDRRNNNHRAEPHTGPGAAVRAPRDGAGARPGLRPQAEGATLPSATTPPP